jgi:CheY-like chemotaxis protein
MKDRPHRRSAGDAKRRPLKPKATPLSARLRILVVEDDANMREGLEVYFSLLGYRAHLAADVASALHAAGEGRFDALLCDIGLPDGDGCEVLRQLDRTGRRPPVVVSMSVLISPEISAVSRAAGFQGHLTKPFTPQQLETALAQAARAVPGQPPSD